MKKKKVGTKKFIKGELEGEQFEIEVVYTDTKGKNYYIFTDPLNMPANRILALQLATNMAEMNITRTEMLEFLSAMKAAFNEGQNIQVANLIVVLEQRLSMACEEETLSDLAKLLIVHEDEDVYIISDKWQHHKQKLMDDDLSVKGFFLQRAYLKMQSSQKPSVPDLLNYIMDNKKQIKKQRRFLPNLGSGS